MNTIYKVFACTICLGLSLNIQLMAEETSSVDAKEKPWITDSPSESVEKLNKDVQKNPERHETYEQVNMSKIKMFPEDYLGRRFVFDKCEIKPRFEEPATLGIPEEDYFAFTIKTLSSDGQIYSSSRIPFIARKTFARQWADKLGDGKFTWGWCVVSGTFCKFGWKFKFGNDIQWHYAFVIDEFVVCNTKTGEPIDSLFFCEVPVSDKRSTETKSFIVINSRLELQLKAKKARELHDQGMKYINGDGVLKNYEKGFSLLCEAADLGDKRASAKLGLQYFYGAGCERDYGKAYAHFANSQDTIFASGFFKGLMEYHGVGTTTDWKMAADSFYSTCGERADNLFSGQAAICLAHMYAMGEGVGRNRKEAKKWFKFGVKTAYPQLVTKAKEPLTERDVAIWRDATGGKSITITPFQWKMAKYIGEEGAFGSGGEKMDLLNKALIFAFQSDVGIWNDVKDEL